MKGKLVLVGTPIGNLGDMSKRAVEALNNADFIAAEDTRVTIKLLNHFNIKKPMISYFEHNKSKKNKYIIEKILEDKVCVLVTDAGMPAISDPGEEIVELCHQKGINVTVIPGPSAVISAVAVSGIKSGRFTFEGFLSVNKKSRSEHLESLKKESRTMVFYEAPHKLLKTLKDFRKFFGNRKISIVRELTKIHEEVFVTTLDEAINKYENSQIKGEFVLVVQGYEKRDLEDKNKDIETVLKMAGELKKEGYPLTEISKKIAKKTGLKKSDVYKKILNKFCEQE